MCLCVGRVRGRDATRRAPLDSSWCVAFVVAAVAVAAVAVAVAATGASAGFHSFCFLPPRGFSPHTPFLLRDAAPSLHGRVAASQAGVAAVAVAASASESAACAFVIVS